MIFYHAFPGLCNGLYLWAYFNSVGTAFFGLISALFGLISDAVTKQRRLADFRQGTELKLPSNFPFLLWTSNPSFRTGHILFLPFAVTRHSCKNLMELEKIASNTWLWQITFQTSCGLMIVNGQPRIFASASQWLLSAGKYTPRCFYFVEFERAPCGFEIHSRLVSRTNFYALENVRSCWRSVRMASRSRLCVYLFLGALFPTFANCIRPFRVPTNLFVQGTSPHTLPEGIRELRRDVRESEEGIPDEDAETFEGLHNRFRRSLTEPTPNVTVVSAFLSIWVLMDWVFLNIQLKFRLLGIICSFVPCSKPLEVLTLFLCTGLQIPVMKTSSSFLARRKVKAVAKLLVARLWCRTTTAGASQNGLARLGPELQVH